MKNKSWSPEEEILLVNLYYNLKEQNISISSADVQVKELSKTLYNYAQSQGVKVNDTYRNVAGIKMKLHNIEYIDTKGKYGLPAASRIDKEAVALYKNNRIKFERWLSIANKKYFGASCLSDILKMTGNDNVNGNLENDDPDYDNIQYKNGNDEQVHIFEEDSDLYKSSPKGECLLVKELKRLKKSSRDAVDNEKKFTAFKRYMHVHRQVEDNLKETIATANQNNRKCLILLCGNVGDGKSHLISYLKNCHENLLECFDIHNDATESYHPNRDEKQELARVIEEFSDEKLDNGSNKKVIVAINLGVLSNFIESEEGTRFKKLAEFVENKKILIETDIANDVMDNGPFYCVNFGDYHIYRLSNGRVESPYIKDIINKIYVNVSGNVFYDAYTKCVNCDCCEICPVKSNFEFMRNNVANQGVTDIILETVIKDKIILSTRDLLNFFYDITVHPSFDKRNVQKELKKRGLDYIADYSIPNIMFDHDDISPLISHIKNYDFATQRTEYFDEIVTRFYNTEDMGGLFKEFIAPSAILSLILNEIEKLKQDDKQNQLKENRNAMFKIFARLNKLSPKDQSHETVNPEFREFIAYLYSAIRADKQNLKSLYSTVKECIYFWNGSTDTQNLNIRSNQDDYIISTPLEINPDISGYSDPKSETVFDCFPGSINITFCSKKDKSNSASIAIDYDLYKMLKKVQNGYRPSVKDDNMYAGFVAFIKKISSFGDSSDKIIISHYEDEKLKKYMLEADEFDTFTFKEAL